jgi:hypothetical protein
MLEAADLDPKNGIAIVDHQLVFDGSIIHDYHPPVP